jgi:predicted ATPase/class 3 adenylate cyclase
MQTSPGVVTFLFTDIEGSSRLWEEQPERMRGAMERHDAIVRATVARHRGRVVKMLGDGVHAVFDDPLEAVATAIGLQQAFAAAAAGGDIAFAVRAGLHAGVEQERDDDFFGRAVNRAARIMSVAHGGQILLSQAVASLVAPRLAAGIGLRELGEVRLRDLANAERVYQIVHPDLRADFPALRALAATPHNLPQPLTSFVGREREIGEVEALLAKNRLVTLQGVGGIGKTRLSLQVAARVLDDFPDGVWLVELASLTDARLVAQAVSAVVGVKEEEEGRLVEALARYVKTRQLLIVLDNCEHLLQACAELASVLLRAGPRVRILTSSREALHVGGEVTYPVPPLPVPDAFATFLSETVAQNSAARLFVERAVAAQPAFALSDDNAAAIAGICQRLDGIPLALELAAARVRALSVEQIAARLTDRFRLLTSGDRTALPRQQTLRALIDWSYDLLVDDERVLFHRLSVFAGGFTLEAAEAVGGASGEERSALVELLTQLVEKSLVVLDRENGRYRMLETVRQYAQERLAASGDGDAVRERHAGHYLEFAERFGPALLGPQQAAWFARFDLERENLLLVHDWCGLSGDGPAGLRFVHTIKSYLLTRGMPELALRMMREALARRGAQTRDSARSRALFDAGQTCCFMGRYDDARPMLEEGLAIAREIGDPRRAADILQPLGLAVLGLGDRMGARAAFEEALELARKHAGRRDVAAALNALAQFHRIEGALDQAEPLYEQVVAIVREIGDRESTALALLNVAMVYIGRGQGTSARGALVEVDSIVREIGSKPAGQSLIEVCAGLASFEKDWTRAARFFGAAESENALTGMHRDPADEAFLAPRIADAQANLGTVAFTAAVDEGRRVAYADALSEARRWLAGPP